jgi:hypothetical protein
MFVHYVHDLAAYFYRCWHDGRGIMAGNTEYDTFGAVDQGFVDLPSANPEWVTQKGDAGNAQPRRRQVQSPTRRFQGIKTDKM